MENINNVFDYLNFFEGNEELQFQKIILYNIFLREDYTLIEGKIELSGPSITFFGNNGSWSNIKLSPFITYNLEYGCTSGEKIFFRIDDNTFASSTEVYDEITTYIKKYNNNVNAFLEQGINESRLICNSAFRNPEIKDAVQNFIDILSEDLFTNIIVYKLFEQPLGVLSPFLDKYIDLSADEHQFNINILNNNAEISNSILEVKNQFDYFANVMYTHISPNVHFAYLMSFMLLREGLIERYSEIWIRNYDNNADISLGFDNYVLDIVNNNILIENDQVGITALTYFKMRCLPTEQDFRNVYTSVQESVNKAYTLRKKETFSNAILRKRNNKSILTKVTIDDIDMMTGIEFENFVCSLFTKMGYKTEITKASGDQGIDVIASKDGVLVGIQAKCYSNKVGNSAIQEVVAGKKFYNCNKVIVVTNNYFTNAAINLAKINSVILWDRNIIIQKITELL